MAQKIRFPYDMVTLEARIPSGTEKHMGEYPYERTVLMVV
jgi:hypothetical protein